MNELETAQRSADYMLERDRCTAALGIDIDVIAPGEVMAAMTVRDDMVNGFGICHGGIVFTLADTAFAFACNAWNRETRSVAASIDWLAPVSAGERLTAHAAADTRAGRHGYFRVRVTNADGEPVALFSGHAVSRDAALLPD